MLNIHKPSNRHLTIGIPKSMLYYRYYVLWESFFSTLGLQLIVSQDTNKDILQKGSKLAIDETCLITKIYLGHVQSLIAECDYILVPRINNFGLHHDMCTKFSSLYDMCSNIFRSTGQKFIAYNIDERQKLTEEKAFIALGQELGFSKSISHNAYKIAKKEEIKYLKNRIQKQELLYRQEGFKIMIASHSYIIDDPYVGKPVTDYLSEMGVIPLRADIVNRADASKIALKVSPTLKWELSREIVGGLEINKKRIDGIILLSAFPCGPDSMVNEIIMHKFKGIPMLNIILDNQSGTAGLETRLESFVDILRFKEGTL